MTTIFSQTNPERLRSDGGSEFNNAIVKAYLDCKNIKHASELKDIE